MDSLIHTIGKAIIPLFTDPVTFCYYLKLFAEELVLFIYSAFVVLIEWKNATVVLNLGDHTKLD